MGLSTTSSGYNHPVVYSGGQIQDLGTLSGNGSGGAYGINNAGQVVGYAYANGNYHAFLYSGGQMQDLGTLGGPQSIARGINAAGLIVGDAFTSSDIDDAFLYVNGEMQDLNVKFANLLVSGTGSQAGFTSLEQANAINDDDQIVGYGNYWTGTTDETEAFLLNVQAAPEPSAWVLGVIALGSFSFLRVRRRCGTGNGYRTSFASDFNYVATGQNVALRHLPRGLRVFVLAKPDADPAWLTLR